MRIEERIYLVNSQFLKAIKIGERTGNLALSTEVNVYTKTNSCILSYEVKSWNDHESHKFIEKKFNDYMEAFKYYVKTYNKYKAD